MRVGSKKLREIDEGLYHSYLLSETGRALARELLALRELERAVRAAEDGGCAMTVPIYTAVCELDALGPVSD